MKEPRRIVGPPGTGKTHTLERLAREASDEYDGNVVVTTLTRASAQEARSRIELEEDKVGTMHSFLYRFFNAPAMCASKHVTDWNDNHVGYRLSPTTFSRSRRQMDNERYHGQSLHREYDLARALRTDAHLNPRVKEFQRYWEAWKRERKIFEFSDLVELAIAQNMPCPHGAPALFIDEAQDFSRAERIVALGRWDGEHQRYFGGWMNARDETVIVGDPMQELYTWRGSDSRIFSGDIELLDQSYRCPRAVQAVCMRIVDRMQYEGIFPKRLESYVRVIRDWKPRDAEGEVIRRFPGVTGMTSLAHRIGPLAESGKSVMVLATHNRLLRKLAKELEHQGIPYGNRLNERSQFNPLDTDLADAVRAYLKRDRSAREVEALFKMMRIRKGDFGLIRLGARMRSEEMPTDVSQDQVNHFIGSEIPTELLLPFMRSDEQLFLDNVVDASRNQRKAKALFAMARHGGLNPERCRTTLSTIHSAKGGQADVVIVLPDMAVPFAEQWNSRRNWEQRGSIYRMFYVAASRARETLILCEPGMKGEHFVF